AGSDGSLCFLPHSTTRQSIDQPRGGPAARVAARISLAVGECTPSPTGPAIATGRAVSRHGLARGAGTNGRPGATFSQTPRRLASSVAIRSTSAVRNEV